MFTASLHLKETDTGRVTTETVLVYAGRFAVSIAFFALEVTARASDFPLRLRRVCILLPSLDRNCIMAKKVVTQGQPNIFHITLLLVRG